MLGKRFVVSTVVLLTFGGLARAGTGDGHRVLEMMPADLPVTFVVADMEALNKSIVALTKRFDPDSQESGPLDDIKKELKIGKWVGESIDFSRPLAIAQEKTGDEPSVACLCVPGFVKKVKDVSGAREENGVWELTSGSDPASGQKGHSIYAFVKGDYVVAADTKAALEHVRTVERSLADELKGRMETFGGRNILIHVSVAPMRDQALAGLAQGAQMAPMFAMMAGAQGGANPVVITNMINAVFDASTKLVEQIDYIEIAADIDTKAIDATIASGYKAGAIKSYLAEQKPATMDFLTGIEDQPYFAAMGFHVPGKKSPFFNYVLDKVMSAVETAPAAGGTGAGAGAAGPEGTSAKEETPTTPSGQAGSDAIADALKTVTELYRRIEGGNVLVSLSPGGLKELGDLTGGDLPAMRDLMKDAFSAANPLMEKFGAGGTKYEAIGARKIGRTDVELLALRLDMSSPAMAKAAMFYGKDTQFGFGIADERMRFCLGSESDIQSTFSGKIGAPLASAPFVKEALSALPKERNAVILLDIASIMPMVGAMMGQPVAAAVPPGPPIAISVSLAGEPVRVDIHIPVRAMERIKEATTPPQAESM